MDLINNTLICVSASSSLVNSEQVAVARETPKRETEWDTVNGDSMGLRNTAVVERRIPCYFRTSFRRLERDLADREKKKRTNGRSRLDASYLRRFVA